MSVQDAEVRAIYQALARGELNTVLENHDSLIPFLPILSDLLASVSGARKINIIKVLRSNGVFSQLSSLPTLDLTELILDARKEQHLRRKPDSRAQDSVLFDLTRLDDTFARGKIKGMVRVVASQMIHLTEDLNITSCELFQYTGYREHIAAIICMLCFRVPELFNACQIVCRLVKVEGSAFFIERLVLNHPDRAAEILHGLVQLFLESRGTVETRLKCHIQEMGQLASNVATYVSLDHITNIRKRLLLYTLLYPSTLDVSSLLSSLFSESNTTSLVEFVKNESKLFENLLRFSDIRTKLVESVTVIVKECEGQNGPKEDEGFYCSFLDESIQNDLSKATRTLGMMPAVLTHKANTALLLYLNITNQCRISLEVRESKALTELMSLQPCPGEDGDLFTKLSLSLYLSCNSLNQNAEVNGSLRTWLSQLLRAPSLGTAQLLLLVGMHLHSGSYEQISPMLSQCTGITVNVSAGHAATVQTLWSQFQSEAQIVADIAKLPVTPGLSASVPGYLPIHCLSQLITSRNPSCPPRLFDWLSKQIEASEEPVHPVLCDVISASVTFIMSAKGRQTKMEGMCADTLASLLSPSKPTTCRVLSFFYLLLYRRALLSAKSTCPPPDYSTAIVGDDSAKTLLLHTRAHRSSYLSIYPTFLKLLVTQFPFLCDPQQLLAEDEARDHLAKLYTNTDTFNVNTYLRQIRDSLKSQCDSRSFYLINKMLRRHHTMIPAPAVAECVPHVVTCGPRVQRCFGDLWDRCAALNPQQTWLHTARVLIDPALTEETLWQDPINLFGISDEVSRTPVGIRILLSMTKGYVSLCEARLPTGASADENRTLLLTIQNSAIVQMLLDLTEVESEGPIQAGQGHERSALIYSFLHDFFIKNDGLSKLVCWQTFKLSSLEGLVNGVPSLHIATKFCTTMLQQPSLTKQLFAVCLLSYLAVQYPIQQTLGACNKLLAWAQTQCGVAGVVWTLLSAESLVRISTAFPPLVDPITRLFVIQRKTLEQTGMDSVKRQLKAHGDLPEAILRNPGEILAHAFEQLVSGILVRMKGS